MARAGRGKDGKTGAAKFTDGRAVDWENAAFRRARAAFAETAMQEQHQQRSGIRQDPAVPTDGPLQGYIDESKRTHIKGWVWDPRQPDRRVVLELIDGDARLTKVTANQHRSDLRQAGIGDGCFAFTIPLDDNLLPAVRNVLHLRCAETRREVPGSPVIIERITPAAPNRANWGGLLEVSNGFVRGWVPKGTSKFPKSPVIQILDQYENVVTDAFHASGNSQNDAARYWFEAPLKQECFGRGEIRLTALVNGHKFAEARCDLPLRGFLDSISLDRCAGWLLSPDALSRDFQIEVLVNGDRAATAIAVLPRDDLREHHTLAWRKGFDIPLSLNSLSGSLVEVSLRLVGSNIDLFDGPFVLGDRAAVIGAARNVARLSHLATSGLSASERAVLQDALVGFITKHRPSTDQVVLRSLNQRPQQLNDRRLNIIIPIYRDVDVTCECIASVLRHRNSALDNVVLINDCSPEPKMNDILDRFTSEPNVFLIKNEVNLGFVQTVNRGLRLCNEGDVIILNSDTCVFEGGFDELLRIAHSSPDIGSVTALSNNATIFTYPHPSRTTPALDDINWEELAAVALRENSGVVVDVPTGHGFCMLVKAEVLRRVGHFDEKYGRGYGEENDLCCRAADLGFRNVAAAGVFVEHREGVSFGDERPALWAQNRLQLESTFPDYFPAVMEFVRHDNLRKARWALDGFRLNKARMRGQSFILTIENHLDGGTKTAVKDLDTTVGVATLPKLRLSAREGGSVELVAEDPWLLAVFAEGEEEQLFDVLTAADIAGILIHQLLGFSRKFLHRLSGWIKTQPSILFLHDFYPFCPRVNLTDAVGRFCDIPHVDICERCVEFGGAHEASRLDEPSVAGHRALLAEVLTAVRHVVAPSENTRRYFARVFPNLNIRMIPHPQSLWKFPATPRTGSFSEIVLLGAVGPHKGSTALLATARLARLTNPQLRFHVIGYTDIDAELLALGNVTITGPYKDRELGRLIDRTGGRIALFLHGWPETFSYTLSEAVAAGLIPIVPDIGAPAERVRSAKFGVVYQLPFDAEQVLTVLEDACNGRIKLYARGAGPAAFVSRSAIKETRALLRDVTLRSPFPQVPHPIKGRDNSERASSPDPLHA
jgi:GT2 family glycosyltransferase/glycosyltransferase involved in cell wall biosynthesis